MKVDRVEDSRRLARATAAYGKATAGEASAVSPLKAVTAASVLGIPEAEFTPKVRDAIMTLMHEVDRLRHELDETRSRIDDLKRAADEDSLLPVLNRRAFVREVNRFIAFAARHGTPSSLLYFDLNDFKEVNDRFGHAAGDLALKHFVDIIAGQIRETDVLARLGGDEFGVILSHVRREQALTKGASLLKALNDNPFYWDGSAIRLDFSYGALELHAGLNADAAMQKADEQMYAQKRTK